MTISTITTMTLTIRDLMTYALVWALIVAAIAAAPSLHPIEAIAVIVAYYVTTYRFVTK